MNKTSIILLLCLSLISISALQIRTQMEASQQIKQYPDHVSMVFVSSTDPECGRCDMANKFYDGFQEDNEGIIKSYYLDCDLIKDEPIQVQRLPMCGQGRSKDLPVVTFFSPVVEDFEVYRWKENRLPRDLAYSGAVTVSHLTEYGRKLLPNYFRKLDSLAELDDFLSSKLIPTKVLLFNSQEKTPDVFKSLAAQYLNRLDFAEVEDLSQITQQYAITQFPAILILKWNAETKEYEQERYKGPQKFNDLKTYFSRHALEKAASKTSSFSSIFANPTVENMSYDQSASLFKPHERWTLVSYYSKETAKNSAKIQAQIKDLQTRFGTMFTYFKIVCSSVDTQCQNWGTTKLGISPSNNAVNILLPYGKRDQNKQIILGDDQKVSEIAKEMLTLSPAVEPVIEDGKNIMGQISGSKQKNKVLAVWFYNMNDYESRAIVHTISAIPSLNKYIDFHRYLDPKPALIEEWGLNPTPSFRMFFDANELKGNYEKLDYPGNEYRFLELMKIISDRRDIKEEEVIKNLQIEEITTQTNMQEQCLTGRDPCIITFVNKAKEGKSAQEIDQFKIARGMNMDNNFKWVSVDGLCHDYLLKQFKLNVSNLPVTVYLDTDKLRYQTSAGLEFNGQNIGQFIQTANLEQQQLPKLEDYDLDLIDSKDCNQIRQIWQDNHLQQQQEQKASSQQKEDL